MVLKGYHKSYVYMGWIEKLNKYMPFACERDYVEWVEEQEVEDE